MNDKEYHDIFFNRANVENAEKQTCESCLEPVVFFLKDQKNNEFSMGLSTILECIAFAIQEGNLPKLPEKWLYNVDSRYNTCLSQYEDISYSENTENWIKEIFYD